MTPPMTNDLIERLRAQAAYDRAHYPPANPLFSEAAAHIEAQAERIRELEAEKAGHEEAFHGVVRAKIEMEARLEQMTRNHDETLRLFSHWKSRAEQAEARKDKENG